MSDQEKEDGPLSKFCQEIKDSGAVGETFLRYLANSKDLTLFAPSNSAWDDDNLKNIVRRSKDFEELLKLHVVPNKVLFMDDILKDNQDHVSLSQIFGKATLLFIFIRCIEHRRIVREKICTSMQLM